MILRPRLSTGLPLSDLNLIILEKNTLWRVCDESHRNFERNIIKACGVLLIERNYLRNLGHSRVLKIAQLSKKGMRLISLIKNKIENYQKLSKEISIHFSSID